MARAGYGHAGHKKTNGVGPAPLGWPEDLDWSKYKGSTSSQLRVNDVTRIIISMLEAAGYDPATHVVPPEAEPHGSEVTDEVALVHQAGEVLLPVEGGQVDEDEPDAMEEEVAGMENLGDLIMEDINQL